MRYSDGQERLMIMNAAPLLGRLAANPLHEEAAYGPPAADVAEVLANCQTFDPSPTVLRQYSRPHPAWRMGDQGEDFAALIHGICSDEKTKEAYLSWLCELRPEKIVDVGTLPGAIGEPMFMLTEDFGKIRRRLPAPVLSDGTLRFAAIVAAFFQASMPAIITLEEIENGIHPSRLRALVELLRSQSKRSKTQVFATTHSPTTLEWLHESEYRTTFLCSRDESTGESTIRPLSEVPHFAEVIEKAPLADLLAEGWLEMAL